MPFPSPGDLPDPGMEPTCPALAGRFFITEPPGKPPKSCPILGSHVLPLLSGSSSTSILVLVLRVPEINIQRLKGKTSPDPRECSNKKFTHWATHPWVNSFLWYLASLSLSFLTCRMGLMITYTTQSCWEGYIKQGMPRPWQSAWLQRRVHRW